MVNSALSKYTFPICFNCKSHKINSKINYNDSINKTLMQSYKKIRYSSNFIIKLKTFIKV